MQQGLKSKQRQWLELFTLAGSHTGVDMFAGMLAVLLPAIREKFAMSLTLGVILLSTQSLACNGVQLLVGHLRSHQRTLLFIPVGILLASMLCLIGIVPESTLAVFWIFLITVVSGVGIAIFHPESLRAVHNLKAIPSATTSAIFIMAGFFGISGGAWLATMVVSHWGFQGLLSLIIWPVLFVILIKGLKIQLANEEDARQDAAREKIRHLSVWSLYAMFLPTGIAMTIIMSLLPTRLHELGYPLTYGGMTNMVIGVGGIIGSLTMAQLAARHRGRELRYVIWALIAAVPLFVLYLFRMEHVFAIGLMFPYGFFAAASYPLIVSMARYARGGNLGFRMGIIVGGVWGGAHLVLMAISPLVERLGVQAILNVIWVGFLFSAITGMVLYRKGLRAEISRDVEPAEPIVCFTDTMIAEPQELT